MDPGRAPARRHGDALDALLAEPGDLPRAALRVAGPLAPPGMEAKLARRMARVWYLSGRWLPQGWLDAFRQLLLFAGAYYAYRIVRGVVDGQTAVAFEHARELVTVERSLGLFFEPGLQHWALQNQWIVDAANWSYVNSHFMITTSFLIWLYLARNESYYYV